MTQNQIAYRKMLLENRNRRLELTENRRHSMASEDVERGKLAESLRSNQAKERIEVRKLGETKRSNLRDEALKQAQNAETERYNRVRAQLEESAQAETKRSNLEKADLERAKQSETHRSNVQDETAKWAELTEKHRANVADETEEHRSNVTDEDRRMKEAALNLMKLYSTDNEQTQNYTKEMSEAFDRALKLGSKGTGVSLDYETAKKISDGLKHIGRESGSKITLEQALKALETGELPRPEKSITPPTNNPLQPAKPKKKAPPKQDVRVDPKHLDEWLRDKGGTQITGQTTGYSDNTFARFRTNRK